LFAKKPEKLAKSRKFAVFTPKNADFYLYLARRFGGGSYAKKQWFLTL
jgi:hypothetical protein